MFDSLFRTLDAEFLPKSMDTLSKALDLKQERMLMAEEDLARVEQLRPVPQAPRRARERGFKAGLQSVQKPPPMRHERLTLVRAAREQSRQNQQVPWRKKPMFDLIPNALSGACDKAQPMAPRKIVEVLHANPG